jgi:type IV pilus assembly protein PilO
VGIQLQDKKTQKAVLGGVLLSALLYAYFLTTYVPFTYKASAAEIKNLSGEYREMASDITKARQTLNSLPYLEKEASLLHRKWEEAKALLPDEAESATILRTVALLGDRCGVEFVLFRPMPTQASQYYTEHPIEVKVEGGYNEVGLFLGELAGMERIVTVSDLVIETVKGERSDKPAVASFIATTYTLGGTGVPAEVVAAEKETENGVAKKVRQAKNLGVKLKAKSRGESGNE